MAQALGADRDAGQLLGRCAIEGHVARRGQGVRADRRSQAIRKLPLQARVAGLRHRATTTRRLAAAIAAGVDA